MNQFIEKITSSSFSFLLGQIIDVVDNFEYPLGSDHTMWVLSGLLYVCQFMLVIGLLRKIKLIRRTASLPTPETYIVSA